MTGSADELTRGWKIHQAGDHAGAEKIYLDVLRRDPNNANGWCYLGIVQHDRDRFTDAVESYRRALALQPNFPIALNNMGNSLRMLRRVRESIACFDQAARLKPDYFNAYRNKGTALLWEGFIPEALESYRQALRIAPNDAESHKNIGVIQLLRGDFAEGWPEYEWRTKAVERLLPAVPAPRWQGEPLDGRTILLVGEQGIGDSLQFARYAAVLKRRYSCRVALCVLRPAIPLLKRVAGIDELTAIGEPLPTTDYWLPLMSVAGALGQVRPEQFPWDGPYLSVDDERIARWRETLSAYPGVKIGIGWAGSPDFAADRYRSLLLPELLAPFARFQNIHFISLQKGAGAKQLSLLDGLGPVVDFGEKLDADAPFLDTAAIMKNVDLVISADTSTAHLAGALGVPLWLLLGKVPDWRWMLDRDDSPWYPTARLFRQTAVGDWGPVFTRVADTAAERFPTIRRKSPSEMRLATVGNNRVVRARHGLLLYNRHDAYIGKSLENYGEFSEGEHDLFRQIVHPGDVAIEVGANIGSLTVPLARLVGSSGRIIAFEPQRSVFQTLCANIALNSLDNVECHWKAVGSAAGEIVVPVLDPSQTTNFGGLGLGEYQRGERVPVATIDSLELPRCALLKVDVEGMELEVFRGAKRTLDRCQPVLYFENDRQEKSSALLAFLLECGYRLFWHLPRMFSAGNYYGNAENVFGVIVSVNVLGVPPRSNANVVGLREITAPSDFWRDVR
jgi:FkbM family methyltransferase